MGVKNIKYTKHNIIIYMYYVEMYRYIKQIFAVSVLFVTVNLYTYNIGIIRPYTLNKKHNPKTELQISK